MKLSIVKGKLGVIIFTLIALNTLSLSSAEASYKAIVIKKPISSTMRILSIGDSITEGMVDMTHKVWYGNYANEMNLSLIAQGYRPVFLGTVAPPRKYLNPETYPKPVNTEGHGGYCLAANYHNCLVNPMNPKAKNSILDNINIYLGNVTPDLVILQGGVNDLNSINTHKMKVLPSVSMLKLVDITHKKYPNSKIIILSIFSTHPELKNEISHYNSYMENTFQKSSFIKFLPLKKLSNPTLLDKDGIHPNNKGYKQISKDIMKAVTTW